jgi:ubiquitin C-terminal hydrolase
MQRGSKTLHELIDNFLQVEELTDPYFCSKCKRYNKSRRKLDLWKTPKLLMIQLKRFKYGKLTK